MKIDIISDAVCPWCYVGKKHLEKALAQRPGLVVDIHWYPYQLHPEAPLEGYDYRASIDRKYGRETIERMFTQITQVGRATGIDFHLDRIARGANTINAHRLLYWARQAGVQNAVCEAIFEAYFCAGRDIGDSETLVAIAAANGMDANQIRSRLATDEDKDTVRELCTFASRQGVSSVPQFIFDGGFTLGGAQHENVFLRMLDRAAEAAGNGQQCTTDSCL